MNLETQILKVNPKDRNNHTVHPKESDPPPSTPEEEVHDIRCKASFNLSIFFLSFRPVFISLWFLCQLDVVKNKDLRHGPGPAPQRPRAQGGSQG